MMNDSDKRKASADAIRKAVAAMTRPQAPVQITDLRRIIESQRENIVRQEREIGRLQREIERISRNCPSEHW